MGKKTTENKVGAMVSKQKQNNSFTKRKEFWAFPLKGTGSQNSVLFALYTEACPSCVSAKLL